MMFFFFSIQNHYLLYFITPQQKKRNICLLFPRYKQIIFAIKISFVYNCTHTHMYYIYGGTGLYFDKELT